MRRITGQIQPYSWGSRVALAELQGRPTPTEHPEAEMWFGTHPAAPSRVAESDVSLAEIIDADRAGQLGEHDELTFLLKLLAADQALSIQAHPTREQAREGFTRENDAGIPLNAFDRNYRDDNHKPELLVALTPFTALAGFRPAAESKRFLEALEVPGFESMLAMLGSGDDAADLRILFTTLITAPQETTLPMCEGLAEACRAKGPTLPESWMREAAEVLATVAGQFPGDTGILAASLLNVVVLEPGEGLYLDAGQLHAYVGGFGVEIMANSDNVLRGGLTTKHIDVGELMRVVRFEPLGDPRIIPDDDGLYETPAPEFRLRHVQQGTEAPVNGPALVLAVGETMVGGETLTPGEAMWIAAEDGQVACSSVGVGAFIGQPGQ